MFSARRLFAVRSGAVIPLLLAAATVLLGLPALSWPASTHDEMILLVYPQRMLGGDLPYRDFFSAYGPTHWWLLEGWFRATELTVESARWLGLLIHVALVLAVHRLVLPWGRGQAIVSAGLAALLVSKLGDAPYAWVTVATLCLWQLVALRPGTAATTRSACFAGLLAGLAIGVRPDALLLALVAPLPLLRATGRWRLWVTGLALGAAPVALALAMAPGQLIEDIVLGRASRGAGQSRLPLLPDSDDAQRMLVVLLASVLLAIVCARFVRRAEATALALLGVFALPQALQRADGTHFVYAGLLSLPLLPVVVARLVTALPRPPRRATLVGSLAGVAVFLLGFGATVPLALWNDPPAVVRHDGRSVPEGHVRAAALNALLPVVDALSEPGDRLFVFDANLIRPELTDVGLYYLLPNLGQRAHNLEITPGLSNAPGSGVAEDLLDADVVILVTASEEFRQFLFPYAEDGSQRPQLVLDRTFCHRHTIAYYDVYTRCQDRA